MLYIKLGHNIYRQIVTISKIHILIAAISFKLWHKKLTSVLELSVHLENKAKTGIGFEKLVWTVFTSVSKTSNVVVAFKHFPSAHARAAAEYKMCIPNKLQFAKSGGAY